MTHLLEGEVVAAVDPQIERLHAKIRTLERDAADAKVEARRAREDADRALSMLRKQLSPLYRALQAVFGELDAAGVTESVAPQSAPTNGGAPVIDARVKAVWDAWKQKLNTPCGRIVDALLIHQDMNTTQLSVAAQMHKSKGIKPLTNPRASVGLAPCTRKSVFDAYSPSAQFQRGVWLYGAGLRTELITSQTLIGCGTSSLAVD